MEGKIFTEVIGMASPPFECWQMEQHGKTMLLCQQDPAGVARHDQRL
jgi:hypothetical protein